MMMKYNISKLLPKSVLHGVQSTQAFSSTVLRGAKGMMGTAKPMQPEQALIIYEMEGCPYCRRVREVMTHLNLDYESRPAPHKGMVYRDELKQLSGATQVPYLIDKNNDVQMPESQDIIDYLFEHYSKKGSTPKQFQTPSKIDVALNKLTTAASMLRGLNATHPEKNNARGKPDELLHLYGFEASPFCRLVRERLCELEVAYINHNVAREQLQDIGGLGLRLNVGKYQPVKGGKRERIMQQVMDSKMQVPYLLDPNTGAQMFESADILAYLDKTYG